MEEKNSLAVLDEETGFIGELTSKVTSYTSLPMVTDEDKENAYNLTSNPNQRVSDNVGKIINLKHVYVESITLTNDQTGEVNTAPRIILIDDKGIGYVSVSKGIFNSVKKIFQLFGTPDMWSKPIKVEVKQVTIKEKRTLTLIIASK